nr:LysR family transcriptional regulator [uncultured Holophaga sp.]
MDMKQLKCFLAVARHRSFTRAAASLFLSQPAVSQQVSGLEVQLGVRLFLRDTHQVCLTPSGERFLATVSRLVDDYEAVVEELRREERSRAGVFTLGFFGATETTWLPERLNRLRRRHPQVLVQMKRYSLAGLARALEEGEIQVGFTLSVGWREDPAFASRVLRSSPSVVVLRPDHPLAGRSRLSYADLRDQRIVIERAEEAPMAVERLERHCAREGFPLQVAQWASDFETILLLVEAGEGIAVLTRHMVEAYPNYKVRCIDMEGEDAVVRDLMVWPRKSPHPFLPRFLEAVGV